MHSDKRVHNAGVQLQIASLVDANFQTQLLLVWLLELLIELQHRFDLSEKFGGSLSFFATITSQSEPVT